jgi:hypothetical protein
MSHGEQEIVVNRDDDEQEDADMDDVEPTCSIQSTEFADVHHAAEDDTDETVEQQELTQMLRGFEKDYEKDVALYKKFKRMVDDLTTPMYKDCKPEHTKMATVLELLQMKEKFKWSDRSVTVLLRFLQYFLPEGNQMPRSNYQAKRIVCPLGLEIEKIHACKNDCMLFRGDANKDLTECTVCKHPRFKPRKDLEDDGSEDDTETEPEKNNNKNKKNKKNKQKKTKNKKEKHSVESVLVPTHWSSCETLIFKP